MRRSLALTATLSLLLPCAGLRADEAPVPADQDRDDVQIQRVTLRHGKWTFHVDVRNRWSQSIRDARGRVSVIGDRQATITIESDGYRDGRTYVSLRDTQTTYYPSVRLDEPSVWFDVVDEDHQALQHSSRQDHLGVWGDEFRFVSRIPAEGFTRFTSWDVEVRVNHMIPFGEDVRVRDLGDYREIEVTVKRRDMTSWNNRMELRVPSDEALPEAVTEEQQPVDSRGRFRKQAWTELHDPVE